MHIQTDRALIPAHAPSVRHLLITIAAPSSQRPAQDRDPVNVALVLDRSGSMDGQKIEHARNAVAHAIRLLDGRDRFALVVYDDRADTVVASTPASAEAKTMALKRLSAIDTRGSTDLAGAWSAGAEHAAAGEVGVRRVLLLTDGLANQGVVDPAELAAMAAQFRASGVVTSTFGVGTDFDEELLARLAVEGGGHFYFIERARQIPDFLASELGETLEVVARDVMLDLTCGHGVEATVLNGVVVEASEGRVRVRLGDFVADQEMTLAVAVKCAAHPPEATAFVDCRATDRDGTLYREPLRVEWRAAGAAENDTQPVNAAVLVAAAEMLAEQARSAALAANRHGDFDAAGRIIRNIIYHLRALTPGHAAIDALIARLEQDERELGEAMAPLAMKARHFEGYAVAYSRDPEGKSKRRR